MPADILGTRVFRAQTGTFELRRGPIFTDVLLADEVNRTPPKTQAALLEAMEERQVTIDGAREPLPAGFFVVATQNPVEYEGTYPLPEAQTDRFLLKVRIGYPDAADEPEILRRAAAGFDGHDLDAAGVAPGPLPRRAGGAARARARPARLARRSSSTSRGSCARAASSLGSGSGRARAPASRSSPRPARARRSAAPSGSRPTT